MNDHISTGDDFLIIGQIDLELCCNHSHKTGATSQLAGNKNKITESKTRRAFCHLIQTQGTDVEGCRGLYCLVIANSLADADRFDLRNE